MAGLDPAISFSPAPSENRACSKSVILRRTASAVPRRMNRPSILRGSLALAPQDDGSGSVAFQIQLSNSQVSSSSQAVSRRRFPSRPSICAPRKSAERVLAPKRGSGAPLGAIWCGGFLRKKPHRPCDRPVSPYGAPPRRFKILGAPLPFGPGLDPCGRREGLRNEPCAP